MMADAKKKEHFFCFSDKTHVFLPHFFFLQQEFFFLLHKEE